MGSSAPADRARVSSWARSALVIVAWTFAAALLGQVLLAGLGVFAGAGWWLRHKAWVNIFQWLSVVAFVLVFVARSSRGAKWLAGSTLLLLWMQYWTAEQRLIPGHQRWAAAHPVGGMLLFWTATELGRRAWVERRGVLTGV